MGEADGPVTSVDRVIGTVLVVSAVANIVAARSTVFTLPVLALIALILFVGERRSLREFLPLPPSSLPLAAFLSLAVISAAWSADGISTLTYSVMILGVLLLWHIVNRWIWTEQLYRIRHVTYWFAIAVLIGSLVLAFEVIGNQYFRRLLIDNFGILTPPTLEKHWEIDAFGRSHIYAFELNRSVATANMLLWPAILGALSWWTGRKFALIAGAIGASVALATLASSHETSKLAVIAGVVCFVVAQIRLRAAVWATGAAWVLLLAAVPYASHVAYTDLELNKASWLQHSAQERIVIWGDIADRVAEAPVIGVGARTGYVLSNRTKANLQPPIKARARTIARHAHNIYLQTWFELGAVGAMLLLVAGLCALHAISRLDDRVQAFALATFAVFMIEIASTWEIWQRWYAALFAMTAVYLALAIRSMEGASGPVPPGGDASRGP
jgi:O-antigen ligase